MQNGSFCADKVGPTGRARWSSIQRTGKVRVMVADNQPAVRVGLKTLLEAKPGFTVVSEACDARDILAKLGRQRVDILTYEPRVGGRGLDLLPEIKRHHPTMAVLVYTADHSERLGVLAIQAGADGYLLKDSSVEELLHALERLSRGERHIPDSIASQLAAVVARREPITQLSVREQHVMTGICSGLTLKEIGAHLSIDARTVSTYRKRVLKKLNMTTNAELIQYGAASQVN